MEKMIYTHFVTGTVFKKIGFMNAISADEVPYHVVFVFISFCS
jgi:hypothetical protein